MKPRKFSMVVLLCVAMLAMSFSICLASSEINPVLVTTDSSGLELQTDQTNAPDNNTGYSNEELKSMERFSKSFLEEQNKACKAHDKLIQSFGTVETIKACDYPEYFGGDYINDEGKLVIYVKGDITDYKQDFINRTGTNNIILEPCKYSFKTLTEIMDILNAYKQTKPDDPVSSNFNSYEILDNQNKIVVNLDEYNQEQVDAFKTQVLDSPAIEFKKAVGKIEATVDVNPGSWVTCNNLDGSMGYRARRNNVNGIVTVAHLVTAINDDYYCKANQINAALGTSRY